MDLDWKDFERVTCYLELVNELVDQCVGFVPIPARSGNKVPNDYEFSENDLLIPPGIELP